jgi:hypothetical protein
VADVPYGLFTPALQRLTGQPGQWLKNPFSYANTFLKFQTSVHVCPAVFHRSDGLPKGRTGQSAYARKRPGNVGRQGEIFLHHRPAVGCACGPVDYGKVRITVQNNQITNVVSLKDNQPVPETGGGCSARWKNYFKR